MLQFLGRLLVYYIMAIVALSFLGRFSKRARFLSRVLSCYLLLMSCAAYGVLASIALRLVGRVGLAQWAVARAFKTVTQPVTGIKFVVDREDILENTKPAVFMSNHQTELDIVMLGKVFPKNCSVTAKRSLKYIPFLGWFMSLSGAVFIDRANRNTAISAFDAAVQDMKTRQQSVFIFPEGTRSYFSKPDLLPFKKGAFHLAVQAGVPIVPIIVGNYAHVLHVQSMTFDSGTVKVKVLDPIPTTGLTAADVDGLSKKVRELMLKEIKAIGGGVEESPKSK